MRKVDIIKALEESGKYIKVKINKAGEITGMLAAQDHPYHTPTNTGGRRYLGDTLDQTFMAWLAAWE